MKKLESHRDVLNALLRGKKVKQGHWVSTTFHLNEEGMLVTHKGRLAGSLKMDSCTDWFLDVPMKTVAQYAWQSSTNERWYLFDRMLTHEEVHKIKDKDDDILDVQIVGELEDVECKGVEYGN